MNARVQRSFAPFVYGIDFTFPLLRRAVKKSETNRNVLIRRIVIVDITVRVDIAHISRGITRRL